MPALSVRDADNISWFGPATTLISKAVYSLGCLGLQRGEELALLPCDSTPQFPLDADIPGHTQILQGLILSGQIGFRPAPSCSPGAFLYLNRGPRQQFKQSWIWVAPQKNCILANDRRTPMSPGSGRIFEEADSSALQRTTTLYLSCSATDVELSTIISLR